MRKFISTFLIMIVFLGILHSNELKKISIKLKWEHSFQFAGFYIAKQNGYYKDIGLDVEIRERKRGEDIFDEILTQKSTFGISDSSLIYQKMRNKPLIAMAIIIQSSPLALISLKDSNISTIKDLRGKKISFPNKNFQNISILAMLKSKGIDENEMELISNEKFGLDDLINGEVDAKAVYTTDQPYRLKRLGIEYNLFRPKDYGFNFYGDTLFTSKKFAENNQKLVENFIKASLDGWIFAFYHIDFTINLIMKKYNPKNFTYEKLLSEAEDIKKLSGFEDKNYGKISFFRVQNIANIYSLIDSSIPIYNLKDFIFKAEGFKLNLKEKLYLKKKKEIKFCIKDNYMPYEKLKKGTHIGITSHYIKIFQSEINIPIKFVKTKNWSECLKKLKEKKCDITPLIPKNLEVYEKFLKSTNPYIDYNLVIATKLDSSYINSFEEVINKTFIYTPDSQDFIDSLKKIYPKIKLIKAKNRDEAVEKVLNSKVYGYIDTYYSLAYFIKNRYFNQLKISGKIDKIKFYGAVGVRSDEPILIDIFNKIIESIDENIKKEIEKNWIEIRYETVNDIKYLKEILFIAFIIIVLLMYRMWTNYKFKNRLKIKNQELNKSLDIFKKEIEIEVNKNLQKDKMIYQQAKMAAMGEMIGNIAHQWRQPLNALNINIEMLEYDYQDGLLNEESIVKFINKNTKTIHYLSKTIDDFRNFYKSDKIKSNFSLKNCIEEVLNITSSLLETNYIILTVTGSDVLIYGCQNELKQVFINLINNAKDALIFSMDNGKIKNGKINIEIRKTKGNLLIIISDNGGGVPEDIKDKIFNPYFTTKFQSQGTGLGLYMSKMIIENNMKGKLRLENSEIGAKFIINLTL